MTEEPQKAESNGDQDFEQRVETVLDQKINPALAMHGGWVRLAKVVGTDVHLELGGGCKGCPGARMTIRYVVDEALRKDIPEIGQVIDATDH